jgi:uncharacterized membrane protein
MATKKLSTFLVLCFTLAMTLALTAPQLRAQTYTTIDVPGAAETDANDLNTKGVIVGFDCMTDLCANGATAQAWVQINGTFKFLKPPGSTQSFAYGINDANTVVGWYYDSASVQHGFSFSKGKYTKIDPPGSTLTNVWSINSAGTMVGTFVDSAGVQHGFMDAGGTFTNIDVPGNQLLSEATGLNNKGQIVGIYLTNASTAVEHGFTLNNGTYKTVDFPGSSLTGADRINDSGEIVGLWGTSGLNPPFMGWQKVGGTFTAVNFPSSTETRCRGVNNAGIIVGRYTDAAGLIHGMMVGP